LTVIDILGIVLITSIAVDMKGLAVDTYYAKAYMQERLDAAEERRLQGEARKNRPPYGARPTPGSFLAAVWRRLSAKSEQAAANTAVGQPACCAN
jgi:hypothetical protein